LLFSTRSIKLISKVLPINTTLHL